MDHLRYIRSRIATIPRSCGVYRWIDNKGDVLYVGKARNLRDRLRSYVTKNMDRSAGVWKKSLRERIWDVEITLTQSELEALILETNLIKTLKPKYNVLMKDDKNYVYVCVTIGDQYPCVDIVRRMGDRASKYFGPFITAREVKELLDMLHELWGWRACKRSLDILNRNKNNESSMKNEKECLECQIGRCNGLCIGKISQEEYRERIAKVMRFLKGDRKEATTQLRDLMKEAAIGRKFERAAYYRDLLERLTSQEEQVVSDTSRENLDVIGLAVHKDKIQVVLLRERSGRLIGELSFVLNGKFDTTSSAMAQFIEQYYSESTDVPEEIILGEKVQEASLIEEWLGNVRLHIPERGKKRKLLTMAEFNATEKLKQQFASFEREKQERKSALQELKHLLTLKRPPRRIEGYDISHLSGAETVGSMVVFRSGRPANEDYRSFTIRTLKSGDIDDYAALREVLQRRLKYLFDEQYRETLEGKKKKPDLSLMSMPDLLVIDGGKGQLGTAMDVLKKLQLDIPVIALAKREEDVFRPDDPLPIPFSSDSPAVFLLMRLRDEAHRRAHQHHEKRHMRQLGL